MYHLNKLYQKGITAVFSFLLVMVSGIIMARGAQKPDNQTVKAGVFYFDGYHMKDGVGNLAGYGIEFLNLVSRYSHLNFVYTGYDKSWDEMLSMLKNGEIDVVTSARKTPEREKEFAFSLPIGKNRTILSARALDNRLHSGNYSSYDGITVGVIAGSSQNENFLEFAEKKRFSVTIREYEDSEKMTDALQKGRIDAVLSSDLRRAENEKILETISSDNFYAIVRKDDTKLLDELDYAIEQLHMNEGDWANVLYYKYYGPVYSDALEFNEREQAYIRDVAAGRKKITITAMGDRKPYSFVENGELKGILPDYFAKVMELAGLPYEVAVPRDRTDYYRIAKTNGVDVLIDRRTSDATKETDQYCGFNTDTYMTAGMAKVTRKNFKGMVRTVAVAVPQGDAPLEAGLTDGVQICRYPSRDDALRAVLKGKADAAYVYTYTAQLAVNNDLTDLLHYTIVNGIRFEFRMYVRNSCDHELVTILNKCIAQMPEDLLNQLTAGYTSYVPKDMTIGQYMNVHPEMVIIIFVVMILITGVIVALVLRAGWSRKMLAAARKSQKELQEQFAIVEALTRDYMNVFVVSLENAAVRTIKMKGYVSACMEPESGEEFPYMPVLGRYVQERVYPPDQSYLAEALSLETVKRKLDEDRDYTGSFRVAADDGIHNFQFTYVRVWENSDEKNGFILAGFRNIDDMVRKEQRQKDALAKALAEATHASNAKTTFLNNMSHDIRTPMNAIIGFTSLASSHIDSRELVLNYLDKIMTSSRHLLSLINDVLDMSRIESGKVRIEEKEASLAEIMHDLKTIVQSDVRAKQMEFRIDTLDVSNEIIICDKLRLSQVLLNLLSNAMKYTNPGGTVSVRIIQTDDAPEGYASYQFEIKDTGMGMSKEFLEHLFEPFERERTSTVSGIQGTGLGLAITKNIVDMMNGRITVESEEGKGTAFTVCFCFRIAGEPAGTEIPQELENLRALIIDDDMNTCTSMSKMLSLLGMRPDWTVRGKEAVVRTESALEQKDPYSAYLIDWQMPDMNGVEVARRIRQIAGGQAPVIVLTAYDWADIEEEAREAGVTAFCSKPVFLSELQEILSAPYTTGQDDDKEQPREDLFTGRKILLVEDNEINQEIAQAILEEAGFRIAIANDGVVAVEMMEQASEDAYDLILMDIQMSGMNGYDATRAIRALDNPAKSQIPIVAMTANAFEEDRQMAMESGMNGHISKPIDVAKLMETLKEILSGTSR